MKIPKENIEHLQKELDSISVGYVSMKVEKTITGIRYSFHKDDMRKPIPYKNKDGEK